MALLVIVRLAVPPLVQSLLIKAIERQGLGPANLHVAWQGLSRLHVGDLRLGPTGGLTADSADLFLSLAGLAAGQLDQVTLSGLHVAATIDASGQVLIQDVPTLPVASTGASPAASIPVERIRLENARLDAATPFGPVAIQLDGTIKSGPAGLSADSDLTIGWGAVRITLPSLQIDPPSGAGRHIRTAKAEATLPAYGLVLHDIAADLDWNGSALTLDATIGEMRDALSPARFVPLATQLHAEHKGNRTDFALTAADRRSRLALSAKGSHNTAAGSGQAQIALTAPAFHPGKLQPRDLFPALGQKLPPMDGSIALAGPVAWNAKGVEPRLTVTLADVAADLGVAKIIGGHGTLLITHLTPPATPPGQALSATIELGAAQRLPVDIALQLRSDGAVAIETAMLGLAEGKLSVGDLVIDPSAGLPPDLAVPVRVSGVDLASLLKLIDVAGLSGEGRLDGQLPLRLDNRRTGAQRLVLTQGHLDGRGGGVLRYVGSALPDDPGGAAGSRSVALLRQALQDFHYETLSADLERGPDGAGGITLHLTGANPSLLNGQRFILNIRLDANFDRLADILLAGLDAAESLTRKEVVPER